MHTLLADLSNPAHQAAIVALLDMYCRDEFGACRPLSEDVKERLIPGLIEHGGARVFLAYEAERPVGLAICLKGFSSFRARPLLNIHDIAVAPGERGRGIGRALLAEIEQEARQFGGCKLTLEVRADNELAKGVYERFGFRPTEPQSWFWSKEL